METPRGAGPTRGKGLLAGLPGARSARESPLQLSEPQFPRLSPFWK